MFWNIGIHILAGIFGVSIFNWTTQGIMICALITCGVQGIDMIRVYMATVKRIRQTPTHTQEEQLATFKRRLPVTFSQLFIIKVFAFGLITLVSATIYRSIIG